MHRANPICGAPRIHGELLKLGFTVAQSTVSKYLPRNRKPPSQSWQTFLQNHLREAIAIDFAAVSTVTFGQLCVFVVLSLEQRRLLHINVTPIQRRHGPPAKGRGASRGDDPSAPNSRSRCDLRNRVSAAGYRNGSGRGSDCPALPLAEWLRGAVRWVLAPRALGSRDRSQ